MREAGTLQCAESGSRTDTTMDVIGEAQLPKGTEMVMPGDNVSLEIDLITPIAMEKGLRFAIREGGHTVGVGTVTEVIQLSYQPSAFSPQQEGFG